jgi:lipoate-protein ligase B
MILDLGLIDYGVALKLQRELVHKRTLGLIPDSVLIVEHPAIFTIGRSGSRKNLLVKEDELAGRNIKVLDTDRGGDITFHSPGQLVIYPIVDLKERSRDLHMYLRDLEEVAIGFLARYSVNGGRNAGRTGVWVSGRKIASIGVAARDWVTYHGLSINVNNDTSFFSMINPCGIEGLKVTSLKEITGREIPANEAKRVLLDEFGRLFKLRCMKPLYEFSTTLA